MKIRNNGFGSRLLMALTFLFLYAPIIILIVFSFNAGNSSSVWKGFSLHWYAELLNDRLIMHSVYTTLLVSLLATCTPSASTITQMAQIYGKDADYASAINVVTTLLCIFTMPLMVALYQL